MRATPPCVVTIAGSDSGAGAGVQADLKSIIACGGYGLTVITALTAQNGLGVSGIHAPPPAFVLQQLDAVLEGFPVRAGKTGMLFSSAIIEAVADRLATRPFPLVVDPVSVSQSGHRLLEPDAVTALQERMLPLADLATPNRPEAEMLAGMPIRTIHDAAEACRRILAMGPAAVLLKGGHMPQEQGADEDILTDWLALPGKPLLPLTHERVRTPNLHGTGCALSASIATFLGRGLSVEDAVKRAQVYLTACLAASYRPGQGAGPPNHIAPIVC